MGILIVIETLNGQDGYILGVRGVQNIKDGCIFMLCNVRLYFQNSVCLSASRLCVTIVVNMLQCSIISVSKILQFIGNYIYSLSSDLYSTFPTPMFDKSSNFNIHQSTLIDTLVQPSIMDMVS